MIIVGASDLHGGWPRDMPSGDVLVLAGDCLNEDPKLGIRKPFQAQYQLNEDLPKFNAWVESLPYRLKIYVPGNHDWAFEEMPLLSREALSSMKVLVDDGVEFEGIRFWGTPWVPHLQGWAFYAREEKLIAMFSKIPRMQPDVLITHAPPLGILDASQSDHFGSKELLHYIDRAKPKVHIFGHVHESHGRLQRGETLHVNVATAWKEHSPEQVEVFPKPTVGSGDVR